jgi:DeoD family purine-nucleoside phosphorylase
VPIHIRAEPGAYAEACLLPGDPLRAKYIAETYFDNPLQRNGERGMLGYSGEWQGKPVSVQSTGMGCPSAAIVMEELVQLGVKRFLRVGTCGGLQHDLSLGDLIVAVSAVPADGTARHYVGQEPHVPTADWELIHAAVHAAKELDQPLRVGAIASSDTFYDPDPERHKRWSERGVLGVECGVAGQRVHHVDPTEVLGQPDRALDHRGVEVAPGAERDALGDCQRVAAIPARLVADVDAVLTGIPLGNRGLDNAGEQASLELVARGPNLDALHFALLGGFPRRAQLHTSTLYMRCTYV